MFEQIPHLRPDTPLLDTINTPADLRGLPETSLARLADELRAFLLFSVGQTGGHFGAGLGVVELTIALHYVLNTPDDRLIWDVGHQCYPHKILCGRRDAMASIRQKGGISGFPKRTESEYDSFGVGHSSTSISALTGMAEAARLRGYERQQVAVIGDGAMTAGMAYEAINHAAHRGSNILLVLNDNSMSISRNVGGLASYFARIWESETYLPGNNESKHSQRSSSPEIQDCSALFQELGLVYRGPVDGHKLSALIDSLRAMLQQPGPRILHVKTQKGFGFAPAERDPVAYHALTKIEPQKQKPTHSAAQKYQDIFGDWLCDTAGKDLALVGITPAMCEGSGMLRFAERFPERFFDVAIAEQHALTFAAGLACEKMKPVVAIYSTFLQRAYDQLVHDIAAQKLDVTFAIDRAGLVGEDGPTHHGNFDLSYLLCIPNIIVATPSDEDECWQLLSSAYDHNGPAAVRYPRGHGPGTKITKTSPQLPPGQGRLIHHGESIGILNFGCLLDAAREVSEQLDSGLCDMRWAKPLDGSLLLSFAERYDRLITIEDNAAIGGAGARVVQYLQRRGLSTPVLNLGLPDDFVEHGNRRQLLSDVGLDAPGIQEQIRRWLCNDRAPSSSAKDK